MQEEIWKDIIGYEGYYQVSNLGRIKSMDRVIYNKDGHPYHYPGRIRKLVPNPKGYLIVSLSKDCMTRVFLVSRLVAQAFIPNPNNLPQVGHKDDDRDKRNNSVDNLYWTTNYENSNTEGRKKRLSESHMGNKNHMRRKVCVDNKEFDSVYDCAEYCGVSHWMIREWLDVNCNRKMPQKWVDRGLRYEVIT